MNSVNGRRNHDFQLAHFLAGACHTADGAWSLLCDQRQDRRLALGMAKGQALRDEAKRMRAHNALQSGGPAALEAQADLAELEALAPVLAENIAAAEAELATIERMLVALQPLRRFAHLPDAQAHEAAQRDEWRAELLFRAENAVVTTGTVPPDLLATMRQHPDFSASLLPALRALTDELRQAPDALQACQERLTRVPGHLPLLLAAQ
jgi:hypothetical protein